MMIYNTMLTFAAPMTLASEPLRIRTGGEIAPRAAVPA